MNLDFSDDQKFLQEEAKKFFDKEGGLANARTVMDNTLEGDKELWQKIVELGWTGIRIPEAYDGLGLGHLELCVIAEELGRSLAPVPFSSSVYFFTEALIKFASEEIKSDILPKLKFGDPIDLNKTTAQIKDGKKEGENSFYHLQEKVTQSLCFYYQLEILKLAMK